MTGHRWEFTGAVSATRRADLDVVASLAAVAEEIVGSMDILCCHPDPCDSGPHDAAGQPLFKRPVYCVKVSRPLFDRFFNSRHGYRAAYFRSPSEGLAANGLLMRKLTPALVASSPPGNGAALGADFIRHSLDCLSAKAWLAEQNGFCGLCEGEWPPKTDDGEVINGRWERGTSVASRDGRGAPYLTKIKIMGAFLSDGFDELVPARKRRRHWEIHEWGWS